MAGSRELKSDDPSFKGFSAHAVMTDTGIYKYIIGKYASIDQAKEKLSEVRNSFPEAFVVKVEGGVVARP